MDTYKKCFVLALVLLLSLVGGGCQRQVNASSLMLTFADCYGIEGTVYTTEGRPWDAGYLSDEMLMGLYGVQPPIYRSAAVLLCSDLYTVRECGIFVCEDRDDALTTALLLDARIRQLARYDGKTEGDVLSFGNTVVYFSLPDANHARDIWWRLL